MIENPENQTEKSPSFELSEAFTLPDQTEELDFKKLLAEPLFNRSYYLYPGEEFQKLVLETSIPFNGTKGREYQEARILKEIKDKTIMAKLETEPISLNEWRYLFSQLTEKQFLGETTFYVTFDDKNVYALRLEADKSDGGPYGYSVSVEKIDDKTHAMLVQEGRQATLKNTKVISTKKMG